MLPIDKVFEVFCNRIDNMSFDEVFKHIKGTFLKQNIGSQKGLESYLSTYPYWGSLSIKDKDYDSFKKRTTSLKEHINDYRWLYNNLNDYRSKLVLLGVLNNWFDFDYNTIDIAKERLYKQYFDLDIVKCNKDEVFVDLGSYTGDTILDYIHNYGEDMYKKIYCYEISNDIFNKLKNNLKDYKNIEFINKAVSDKKGYVYINTNDTNASANNISNEGNTKIESVCLDDDIKEKITLLKMDIEGAEKDAIKGCKNHIINDTPKLLLSVYHNYEDLYEIPKMINKLNNNYNYYLRFYGGNLFPTEIILICIPKED